MSEAKTHVIDGKTFEEVERQAEVGEKVIIVNAEGAHDMYKNGDVIEVQRLYDSGIENDDVAIGGNSDGLIFHKEYRVLQPVASEEWPPLTEESIELTANDIRWQPDKVIDLLANLARRVSSLERQVDSMSTQLADTQNNVVRHGEELEAVRYGNDEMYLRLKGVEERTASHRQELNVIDHEKEMIFSDIVSISKRIRKLNGGVAE